MPSNKISELPNAGQLTQNGGIPILQGGSLRLADLLAFQNSRATGQYRINEWLKNKPLKALSHPRATQLSADARAAADAILQRARAKRINAIVYADPTATGANDGTSWDDAFTNLIDALGAVPEGGALYTNSTEAQPFLAALVGATVNSNVEWLTDQGPDGETWISGAQKSDAWENTSGNIFRVALATAPQAVAYDYKRDNITGDKTGIDLTQAEYAQTLDVLLDAKSPWGAQDAVAWYGALKKADTATSSPTPGHWSHTGGFLYINPQTATNVANVNDLAIWADTRNALVINSAVSNFHLSGKLTTFFTPATEGGSGYGLRFVEGSKVVIQGTRCIMSGYHSIGCVNNSGDSNIYLDHLTSGHVSVGIPLVWYSGSKSFSNARHRADGVVVLSYDLLGENGAPLTSIHTPRFTYSHTNGIETMSGFYYSRCAALDFSEQMQVASGVTVDGTRMPIFWAADTGETVDITKPETFPVEAAGLVLLGRKAIPPADVYLTGCYSDGLGYGDPSEDQYSASTGSPNDVHNWRLIDSFWKPSVCRSCVSNNGDDDFFYLSDTPVNAKDCAAAFVIFGTDEPEQLRLENVVFDGTVVMVVNPLWQAGKFNLSSLGGNVFSGEAPLKHTNPAVTPKTQSQMLEFIGDAGFDQIASGLNWE